MRHKKMALLAMISFIALSAVALTALSGSSLPLSSITLATTSTKTVTLTGADAVGYAGTNGYNYVESDRDGETHDRIRLEVMCLADEGAYGYFPKESGLYLLGNREGQDYFFRFHNVPAYSDPTYYYGLVLGINGITSFSLTCTCTQSCVLAVTLWGEAGPYGDGFITNCATATEIGTESTTIDYEYQGDDTVRYMKILPFNDPPIGTTFDFTITSLSVTWSC